MDRVPVGGDLHIQGEGGCWICEENMIIKFQYSSPPLFPLSLLMFSPFKIKMMTCILYLINMESFPKHEFPDYKIRNLSVVLSDRLVRRYSPVTVVITLLLLMFLRRKNDTRDSDLHGQQPFIWQDKCTHSTVGNLGRLAGLNSTIFKSWYSASLDTISRPFFKNFSRLTQVPTIEKGQIYYYKLYWPLHFTLLY